MKVITSVMKQAAKKLMEDMKAEKYSLKMFKLVNQIVKDSKKVLANGCFQDEMNALCELERE